MTFGALAASGMMLVGVATAGSAAAPTPVSALGSCSKVDDLRGSTIRTARLEDPFWILRWRRPDAALVKAVAALAGQPYAFETVDAVSRQIESRSWLPDNPDAIIQLHYSDIGLVNCRDRQLDVVFRVFSAAPSPMLSTVFEWGAKDKTADATVGLARAAASEVALDIGFDRARRLAAGGRAKATWSSGRVPIAALEVTGRASTESHVVSAALAGEHESIGAWLRRASWRVVFEDSSAPAGDLHLDERSVGLRFFGTSRPTRGIVTRFGAILDGGRLGSGFAARDLPAHTVAEADFTASRFFAGITGRGRRQSFAASYGVTLGSTGARFHGDWRTHIVDVAHEVWRPTGHHRLFEIEQRLTFGRLQARNDVPVTERFFGGGDDRALVLADDWHLPAGPRIRSIPTNRFAVSRAGGDRFVAYTSTTAFTVWRKPAVPPELLEEEEFNKALRAALTGARSTLEAVYRSGDPSFQDITSSLPELMDRLKRVEAAETTARSSGVLPDEAFERCEDALGSARSAAKHAIAGKPAQAYGWVAEMMPDGNNALSDVVPACGADLAAALRAAAGATADLEAASEALQSATATLEARFAAIDNAKWAKRAEDDMAYARRALDVVLNQVNITSLSPVFVFDVARLGPAGGDPHGGTRYAVGGGVRLTLASTVAMTLTYAVNPRRRAGEGSGALLFSLTTRNLFE